MPDHPLYPILEELVAELRLLRAEIEGHRPAVPGESEPAFVPPRAKHDPLDHAERKAALGLVCVWPDPPCGEIISEQQKRLSEEYCGKALCSLHETQLRRARAMKAATR